MKLFDPQKVVKVPFFSSSPEETGGNTEASPIKSAQSPPGPTKDFETIVLTEEASTLYSAAKELLAAVITDDQVPPNQKAQVLNTVQRILSEIAKTRTELYSSERVKTMELVLLRTLKDQSAKLQARFLEDYERALAANNLR